MAHWLFHVLPGLAQKFQDMKRDAREDPAGWSRREILRLRRQPPQPAARSRVRIDEFLCSDCGACVQICRPGALTRARLQEAAVYSLDARRCNGCGECAGVCAEFALTLEQAAEQGGPLEVVRLPEHSCVSCGQNGTGQVNGLCILCRHPARMSN